MKVKTAFIFFLIAAIGNVGSAIDPYALYDYNNDLYNDYGWWDTYSWYDYAYQQRPYYNYNFDHDWFDRFDPYQKTWEYVPFDYYGHYNHLYIPFGGFTIYRDYEYDD